MPRARRALPARVDTDINEAIVNLAEHHISAVRRRRGGEILNVKHIAHGWLTVKEYYQLQKTHEILESPLLAEFVRGGYQMKAWLWGSEIAVQALATGVTLPMGVILVTVAGALYAVDTLAGDKTAAIMDWACLFLPFGELWLLIRGADMIASFWNKDITPAVGKLIGGAEWWASGLTHFGIDPVQVAQLTNILDRTFGWNKYTPPPPGPSKFTAVLVARPSANVKVGDFLSLSVAIEGMDYVGPLNISYGFIPPGLVWDDVAWNFSGHVTTAGVYAATIGVSDQRNFTANATLSVTVTA